MVKYQFSDTIDDTFVCIVYSAVKITPRLEQSPNFMEMLLRLGFPDKTRSTSSYFGITQSIDFGKSKTIETIPGKKAEAIRGSRHLFHFIKECRLENGYAALEGFYAGRTHPGMIHLTAYGMNCQEGDITALIDSFISESGLEETDVDQKIKDLNLKNPKLEKRLADLRKCSGQED